MSTLNHSRKTGLKKINAEAKAQFNQGVRKLVGDTAQAVKSFKEEVAYGFRPQLQLVA